MDNHLNLSALLLNPSTVHPNLLLGIASIVSGTQVWSRVPRAHPLCPFLWLLLHLTPCPPLKLFLWLLPYLLLCLPHSLSLLLHAQMVQVTFII